MPTILVVEDDPTVQALCRAALSRVGFDAIIRSNGREGLETYMEKHAEIALILSDITMPLMNGIEMIRNIFSEHSHVNVIMMSGHGVSHLIPADLNRICAVLLKPFTHAQLVQTVNKCLKPCDRLL
jgi:DNA-binding NtrC family response regulator